MSVSQATTEQIRHRGPALGIVGAVFVALFLAGLYPVTAFNGTPVFPAPSEPMTVIQRYFAARPEAVLLCAALQFGAAVPLGIFTATAVSRLRFLGIRAAGADIALFGGFLTSFNIMATSSVLWAMTYPEVSQNTSVLQALYRFSFGLGGPGFSVPFGLLIAGITVTAGFARLLPRWLVVAGIAIAAIGELSWFQIIFPSLLPLIPLTRFPGYLWLIAAGFALPASVRRARPAHETTTHEGGGK